MEQIVGHGRGRGDRQHSTPRRRSSSGQIRLHGDQQRLLDSQPVFGALDAVFKAVRDATVYE